MYNSSEKKSTELWGLWADYSWRELAIAGGVIATTAFLAYCICNTQNTSCYFKLNRSSASLLASFFIPLSVATYPTIYKNNKMRKDNLAVYMEIGAELSKIEQFYQVDGIVHPQIIRLIETIKKTAHACLDLEYSDKNISYTAHLLIIHELLHKILSYTNNYFLQKLPKEAEQLDPAVDKAIAFWEQDEMLIKTHFMKECANEEQLGQSLSR